MSASHAVDDLLRRVLVPERLYFPTLPVFPKRCQRLHWRACEFHRTGISIAPELESNRRKQKIDEGCLQPSIRDPVCTMFGSGYRRVATACCRKKSWSPPGNRKFRSKAQVPAGKEP